jgi:YHS domain-containing protein
MLRFALIAVVGIVSGSAGYVTFAACCDSENKTCPATSTTSSVLLLAEAAGTASAPADKVDVKNTKCIVMPEDDAGEMTVEHDGKLYHVCCKSCIKAFKKDPAKYVQALEADPAKFGVAK